MAGRRRATLRLLPTTRSFKQPRAAATHKALLRAAAQVFSERGFDGAQAADIADAAGVSTGAFYRYFANKREIFLEMSIAHLQRARAEIQERLTPDRFAGIGTRDAIGIAVKALFDVVRRDAPLYRVFLAMSLSDPGAAQIRAEFDADERLTLERLIRAIVPPGSIANPAATAHVVQVAALEVAIDACGLRPQHLKLTAESETEHALSDMIDRYLFLENAGGEAVRVQLIVGDKRKLG